MRTASLLSLLPGLLIATAAAPAAAQTAGDAERTDPLRYAGAGATLAGAGSLAAGGLILGLTKGPELCGLTGCVIARDLTARRVGGAFLGAGTGAAMIGVPALLAGLGQPPALGVRRSEPRMLAGFALTDLGAAFLGASFGLMTADKGVWQGTWTAPMTVIFLASGTAAVAIGVPLWVSGQRHQGPRSEAALHPEPPPPPPPPGSGVGLRAAGISLTVAGIVGIAGGAIGMGVADTRGDFGGFNLLPGLIAFGAGNLFASVGIPLWIVGQNKVSAAEKAEGRAPISLTLRTGGTGLWLEGAY